MVGSRGTFVVRGFAPCGSSIRDGFDNALRIGHVIVGVMWMGLLWFFNFVQVPAYAEMDAAARNNALDKLTWRALWWFRWAAIATVVFGILIIAVWPDQYDGDYWKSTAGVTLLLGIIMGLVMAANVWMVIWPNQQIVIAQRAQRAGRRRGEPRRRGGRTAGRDGVPAEHDLLAAAARVHGRRVALLRARNTSDPSPGGGKWGLYFLIGIAIIAVLEVNALGKISGTRQRRPERDLRDPQERDVHRLRADRVLLPARRDPAPELAARSTARRRARRRDGRGATRLVPKSCSLDLMRFT